MNPWVVAANILGWPVIHLLISKISIEIPLERFAIKNSSRRSGTGGREKQLYRNFFKVQRWKSRLPDGAPWLGGFSKKRFVRRDRDYIFTFILETRRAEFAHWCTLGFLPVFFLWNPLWACAVMTVYALAANVPCIVVQRYNRIVLSRLLVRMGPAPPYQAGPKTTKRALSQA